ncbi:hypothetical protein PR048_028313 [Dryococelus australis]|uniref:Uncharacterized protein n=1 Tax=Dryococelus australis TaxID=614101 RepID=A0ABQ9GIY1_9NEOP|nr:hypothetical protein PR048_028313 [Dryococelus australis]
MKKIDNQFLKLSTLGNVRKYNLRIPRECQFTSEAITKGLVRQGEYGAAPECNSRENRRAPRKPAKTSSSGMSDPAHWESKPVCLGKRHCALNNHDSNRYINLAVNATLSLAVRLELEAIALAHPTFSCSISMLYCWMHSTSLNFNTKTSMEQCRNERAGETADPRENSLTSGVIWHDSNIRKSGSDPAGD